MIAGKSTFTHASFTVPEEISALANVEVSVPHVKEMPERASILVPKFTDYVIGLVQALDHRPNRLVNDGTDERNSRDRRKP